MILKTLPGKLSIIFIFAFLANVLAADTYTAVASYFAEYDKVLENITDKAQSVTSLSGTEKMFKDNVDKIAGFEYLMRTNSKGKIIAKVTKEGIQPRDFRFIGKQQWYEIISMSVKPYYGMMKNRKNYSLFWNKPIPVKGKSGVRFGGSISAKIDLKKSFNDIVEQEMAEFTIKLGRKVLFSNLKDDGTKKVSKPLAISGLPVLTIIYSEYADAKNASSSDKASFSVSENKVASSKVATVETKEATSSNKSAEVKNTKNDKISDKSKKVKKDKTKAVKKEATKVEDKATTSKEESKNGKSMIFAIVILLAAIIGVVVAVVIIMQSTNRKRQALLDAIDKGEI